VPRSRAMSLAVALLLWAAPPAAAQAPPAPAREAVAAIYVRTTSGPGLGNGFFIGDGSLVVTALHVVQHQSRQGDHRSPGMVSVLSPYLGEACDAEVVAFDEGLDVAVLRVPWRGHPSLALAGDDEVLSIGQVVVAGLKVMSPSIRAELDHPKAEWAEPDLQTLDIDFVGVLRGVPKIIRLRESGDIEHGWSGSPMLLPDGSAAAGCLTKLEWQRQGPGLARAGALGVAAPRIRRLLQGADLAGHLLPAEETLARPDRAGDAFVVLMQAVHRYIEKRYPGARESAELYVRLRPQSAFGYRIAARAAERQGFLELAGQYYRKALELDPESTTVRVLYVQYLQERGRHEQAYQELQPALGKIRTKPEVALGLYNVLTAQGKTERAAEVMEEAVKREPLNAHFRFYLGQARYNLGQHDASVASLSRAHALHPEDPNIRVVLAQSLAEVGRLEEAEKHLQAVLDANPAHSLATFALAEVYHKAKRFDEAAALLEQAADSGPDQPIVRVRLAQVLGEAGKVDEAEAQWRKLVKLQPQEPRAHFALAAFLAKHRPDATEEALREARIALSLPAPRRFPKRAVEQFIREMEARMGEEDLDRTDPTGAATPAETPDPHDR